MKRGIRQGVYLNNSFLSQPHVWHVYLIQLHNQDSVLRTALKRSIVALDDWLHRYVPEFCHKWHVDETDKRIAQSGGTLAYIADLQLENREALGIKLGKLTTQEQAEQDARCDRECRHDIRVNAEKE